MPRSTLRMFALLLLPLTWISMVANGNISQAERPWRSLPLITNGKVDESWTQIGYGSMVIDDNSLRTECDSWGMGLFLYTKERFGNCQIRVVYRSKDSKSNAGVYIRIDEGILARLNEKAPALQRNEKGELTPKSLQEAQAASEELKGPWYAVHRGFEVQICDEVDEYHRTGAIYSLANAAPVPNLQAADWKTMVITLQGNIVLVDVDGKRITTFDSDGKDPRRERKWYEPKYEAKRPASGYIGLQTHDPGDVVYFKEVSVRPLE
ncbi:MAG: 3-keto-disaccharide hydrolase [bacterium]